MPDTVHKPGCPTIGAKPPSGLERARPDEWIRAIAGWPMTPEANSIALTLARYANKKDGTNARPGLELLAWASKTSKSTCQRVLDKLQGWWVIYCDECPRGRTNAQVFGLCLHDEVEAQTVEFDVWREQGATWSTWQKR